MAVCLQPGLQAEPCGQLPAEQLEAAATAAAGPADGLADLLFK